jgi:hypothetical protein
VTGSQLLDMVMQRLGNRSDTSLRAALALEMAAAQKDVLEGMDFVPWFLLSSLTSAATVASLRSVALPSDFLMEVEDSGLFYTDSSGNMNELAKDEYNYLVKYYAETDSGPPEAYALVGSNYEIFPMPDDAYTLQYYYFLHDAAPTDTATENRWLAQAPLLLLAETGRVGASLYIQNADLAVSFTEEYKRQKDLLWKRNEARAVSNRDIRMGGVA